MTKNKLNNPENSHQEIPENSTSNFDINETRDGSRKFRGLLEAAPDAMVIVDETGKIVLINKQTEKLFGYSPHEILSQNVDTLLPKQLQMAHKQHRSNYLQSPRVRPMGVGLDLKGLRKDGTEFPVEISLSPLQTEEGILIIAAIRDITERKKVEQKIKNLNKSLEQRAADLEIINKELESFSYSVSHDLRAPLRAIDGFSQALLEDYLSSLPPEALDYLGRIRNATHYMSNLIDALLNLAHIIRAPVVHRTVNISELAQGIVSNLRQIDPKRNVTFKISPNLQTNGDSGLLHDALENLINNAWKFTSKVKEAFIEIDGKCENAEQIFFVRDNGAGFDMNYAGKLFGAFQRFHKAAEFPGNGIGLATVQKIIHKHGGRIWAESAVEQGATFFFTLG